MRSWPISAARTWPPCCAPTQRCPGLEEIGKEVILYARGSFEQAAETATALLGAKTFQDVFQLNSEFAKANLERLLTGSAKLSEMSVKLANEALAPIGGRVEATIHKLAKPLAA